MWVHIGLHPRTSQEWVGRCSMGHDDLSARDDNYRQLCLHCLNRARNTTLHMGWSSSWLFHLNDPCRVHHTLLQAVWKDNYDVLTTTNRPNESKHSKDLLYHSDKVVRNHFLNSVDPNSPNIFWTSEQAYSWLRLWLLMQDILLDIYCTSEYRKCVNSYPCNSFRPRPF